MQVDQGLPKGDATIVAIQGTTPWVMATGPANILIDEASATVTYIGEALILGSATSSAVWRIKKITITGSITAIQWPDSSSDYDKIWDDRASYTYN